MADQLVSDSKEALLVVGRVAVCSYYCVLQRKNKSLLGDMVIWGETLAGISQKVE